jgi:hypothetical protein
MTTHNRATAICENGHAMTGVAQEIEMQFGDGLEPSTTWHGEDRGQQSAAGHCRICGAKFVRPNPAKDERWMHAMPWMSDEERAHQNRQT